ncbi:CaiB/BaiF CoA-transferase family protein [Ramlibacter solisilvae]|uniref:CoA-transferase n=1 Tax=Ramlibacter tataouinensis TaxID=94132 RepID=A0A127JZY3_9BURK|nr:CaiB/BaiF CoA-transferase family protein [Ramlibacter tataouinensis]AMO25516.1 CoA-transferase [Ramlibacter tataouinensis]
MTKPATGPLAGLRILEIYGIGPGPFCGMLLADMGADVVVVDRMQLGPEDIDVGKFAVTNRGKRSIMLDLKTAEGVETLLKLVENCDAMIEGMRPGVMERLGIGPEVCLARNPRLVYGRMTGWGQTGPLAPAAGHDLNYIALSGALWYASEPGQPPITPPSLLGDVGGGALYLALGLLAAIMSARATGEGQVIDAAIVDGSANMMNLVLGLKAAGAFANERGRSLLDGPHWYRTYRCADGKFVSVGALEPRFYRLLIEKMGLAGDPLFANPRDAQAWPLLHKQFTEIFATRTRDEWCALLEGSDACFAPVLDPDEAADHPHMAARGVYSRIDGVLQANPAPRFSRTPAQAGSVPGRGQHQQAVLDEWLQGR